MGNECIFCGRELCAGEQGYYINGDWFCEDCRDEYAKMDYAPFLAVVGENHE